MSDIMPCPNCATAMVLSRSIRRVGQNGGTEQPDNVFSCPRCGLVYFTQDCQPMGGRAR
jgi:hypothetical protein